MRPDARAELEKTLNIKAKDFVLLESYYKPWYSHDSRKHKLGHLQKATVNQLNVLCRSITFERMTSYILEDYFNELSRLKQIKMKPYMHGVIGYHIKDTTLCIFQ